MNPKIDIINLGVSDLERARGFYERGFGGTVRTGREALFIDLGHNSSPLSLRRWDVLASDVGVDSNGNGFRAFTISYIVESAAEVDAVLEHAERHGGRVSKPPKNAFWGYSAYVTDPDGYLWKVASSKRRALLGRDEEPALNGHRIEPQEVPLTIGVADMKRSKQFYKDGLGLPVKKAFGDKFVMFDGQEQTSDLGMYKREALAADAAVPADGGGFHGFSLTCVVDSPERVEALMAADTTATSPTSTTTSGRSRPAADRHPALGGGALRRRAGRSTLKGAEHMLGRKDYTQEELDHAVSAVRRQLAAYKKLVKALNGAGDDPKVASALETFEPLLFNNMTLVLDRYFVHRLRTTSGKDGNPVNEVELLADSLINNGGELRGNNVIRYEPEDSVTKLKPGDPIRLSAGEFERLSAAFLADLESKFVK